MAATLNLNRLNLPIKRYRQKSNGISKDIHRLKIKGWEKKVPTKWRAKINK